MQKLLPILLFIYTATLYAGDYEKKDSIVIDKKQGLYWQDDFSSQKSSEDYKEALVFCKELDLNGIKGWRLPTFEELFSITDYARVPPIDPAFTFLSDEHTYWSSTPFASNPSRAWTIDFRTGESYYSYKTTNHAVRCVKEMPKNQQEAK